MSHTPGPWAIGKPTEYINQVKIEPTIGIVYGAGEEVKANAALIAAAPDMLTALEDSERILEWGEPEPKPALARVRAAIAKAKATENPT